MSDGMKYVVILVPFVVTLAALAGVVFKRPYERFQWVALLCMAATFLIETMFDYRIAFEKGVDRNLAFFAVIIGMMSGLLAVFSIIYSPLMNNEARRQLGNRKKE